MRITAVDDKKDLFFLEDVLDTKLITEFNRENINNYRWKYQEWQEHVARHVLIENPNSALKKIKDQLETVPEKINELLKTNFKNIVTTCWHDLEGFEFMKHIDNPGVKTVMQIYIGNASEDLGTVFYQCDDQDVEDIDEKQLWSLINHNLPVRHNFKYVPNTGYLMFNNRTQAHGVTGIIKNNDRRVSCYCYIN